MAPQRRLARGDDDDDDLFGDGSLADDTLSRITEGSNEGGSVTSSAYYS
eukprot:CAMPEP_0195084100 /NCGR_PEP_ID=MMETSP0448-20130528/24859_1 /TAXON_ID=66468 /ORGANISM="Heterocapsa triquestra, Strain CCMP 448" /LENGTH=48 /DNA_ID= /DNA_START= /DNA_END= /DNA_ORIENTATION=